MGERELDPLGFLVFCYEKRWRDQITAEKLDPYPKLAQFHYPQESRCPMIPDI